MRKRAEFENADADLQPDVKSREQLLAEARRNGWEAADRHAHDSWVAEEQGEHIPTSEETPPDDDTELRDAWIRGWYDYEAEG